MGDESTNLSSIGIVISLILILWSLLSPRAIASVPMIIGSSWLTLGQRIVVFDLNFTVIRILAIAFLIRIFIRREWPLIASSKVDRLFLWWTASRIVSFTLLWLSGEAFLNRIGFAVDAIGIYYAFRFSVRDLEDVRRLTKIMVYILAPVAISMFIERQSGYNYFSTFGGVPEWSTVRDGIIRSQGPYSHAILAGTVGAVWWPVFLGLWRARSSRVSAALGVTTTGLMVVTAGSSGPILAVVFSAVGLMLWSLRHRMWLVRRAIVAGLIVLQLGMSEPIWFIFAKVNVLSASTGWHRSHLIDMAVKHFAEWVFVGVKDVAVWGVWAGDITNQYLLEGLRGGLITMWFFIAIIVRLFGAIGLAFRTEWAVTPADRALIWALGATLTAHVVSFFSVAYYESQSMMHWFAAVALIIAATESVTRASSGLLAEQGRSASDGVLYGYSGVGWGARPPGVAL